MQIQLKNSSKWGRNPIERRKIVLELIEKYSTIVVRKQVLEFIQLTQRDINSVSWLLNGKEYRAGRGQYSLRSFLADSIQKQDSANSAQTGV